MNEKLQYAEMLENNVNSCNITYKPSRKRTKKIKEEKIKEQLIEKVNAGTMDTTLDNSGKPFSTSNITAGKSRKIKLNVITVQLCVICLLIATIFLTSVLIPTSGINSFFASVFGNKETVATIDERTYEDFSPVLATVKSEDVLTNNGVMSIKNQNSIYSPCDGSVSKIIEDENGLYTVEIKHNDNFKSVIGGLKYVYVEEESDVYKTLPIGYIDDGEISLCFIDGENNVITDNVVSTCTIKWEE